VTREEFESQQQTGKGGTVVKMFVAASLLTTLLVASTAFAIDTPPPGVPERGTEGPDVRHRVVQPARGTEGPDIRLAGRGLPGSGVAPSILD
jgi:hypothetical protein